MSGRGRRIDADVDAANRNRGGLPYRLSNVESRLEHDAAVRNVSVALETKYLAA